MFSPTFGVRALSILALLAASAAAQAQSDKSVTVKDLLRDQDTLAGQTVTVRGYIRECLPTRCFLYWRQQDWSGRSLYYISLGPDAALDQAVRGKIPGTVVLRGKLDTQCTNHPPVAGRCPGRAPALTALEVVRWGK